MRQIRGIGQFWSLMAAIEDESRALVWHSRCALYIMMFDAICLHSREWYFDDVIRPKSRIMVKQTIRIESSYLDWFIRNHVSLRSV